MSEKDSREIEWESCAVVRDLLPSYLEEICSVESNRLVESHLSECAECRKLAEELRTTEVGGGETEKLTFDYMKKVKRHTRNRELGGFVLLIVFLALSLLLIVKLQGRIAFSVYYATMPLIMIISYVLLADYVAPPFPMKRREERKGNMLWLAWMEALAFVYGIVLQTMVYKWIRADRYPFGMEAYHIGPFVYWQSVCLILIQMLLFLVSMVQSIRRNVSHLVMQNVCVLGSYFNLIYISLIRRMDTVESYMEVRTQAYLVLLAEWVIAMVVFLMLEWRRGKSSGEEV